MRVRRERFLMRSAVCLLLLIAASGGGFSQEDKKIEFKLDLVNQEIDLGAWQKHFADPEKSEVLKEMLREVSEFTKPAILRTRIDRIRFERPDEGKLILRVSGICVSVFSADDPDKTKDSKTLYRATLEKAIEAILRKEFPMIDAYLKKVSDDLPLTLDTQEVVILKNEELPSVVFQTLLGGDGTDQVAREEDGVLLSDAVFNSDGVLEFIGLKPEPKALTDDKLRSTLETKLKGLPATVSDRWLKPTGKRKDVWSIAKLTTWNPVELVQSVLANNKNEDKKLGKMLQSTLVNRVWFAVVTTDGERKPELQVSGVNLGGPKASGEPQAEQAKLIRSTIVKGCDRVWNPPGSPKLPEIEVSLKNLKSIPNPIYLFQDFLGKEHPEFDGTLFAHATYDDKGTLIIEGLVPLSEQKAKLEGLIDEKFVKGKDPLWLRKGSMPLKLNLNNPVIPPSREKIQGKMESNPDRRIGRARLDRLWLRYVGDDGKLTLFADGVAIDPQWDAVKETFAKSLDSEFQTYLAGMDLGTPDVAGVRKLASPLVLLQADASRNPALDGLLFSDAFYRANGDLQFTLLLPESTQDEQYRKSAEGLIRQLPSEGYFRSVPKSDTPTWDVDTRTGGPDLKRLIQNRLAEGTGETDSRQLRLDRAYFNFTKDPRKLRLVCEGVSIHKNFKNIQEPNQKPTVLQALITQEVSTTWKGLEPFSPFVVDLVRIRPLEQLNAKLQALVPDSESLDGIRVYALHDPELHQSFFDKDGRLRIEGYCASLTQKEAMGLLVGQYFQTNRAEIGKNGIQIELALIPAEQILADLRAFASTMDDVRIDRFYFGKNGRPTIEGVYSNTGDEVRIKTKLVELLGAAEKLLPGNVSAELAPGFVSVMLQSKPTFGDPDLTPFQKQVAPAITLQNLLQAPVGVNESPIDPKWDGIRIAPCGRYVDGSWRPKGEFGNEQQRAWFDALLREFATDPDQQKFFPRKWILDDMKTLDVAPFLTGIEIVMPAYPLFNGMLPERLYHDVKGKLILQVRTIGKKNPEAETELLTQIEEHPEWKAHLAKATHFGIAWSRTTAPDEYVAGELTFQALEAYRRGDFPEAIRLATTAIRNNHSRTTAWFVRGMCHLLRGEVIQARRDARRLLAMEMGEERLAQYQMDTRRDSLIRVQGEPRQQFNKTIADVKLEVTDGKRPLRLKDLN